MYRRSLLFTFGTLVLLVAQAGYGQPLLDRVLDRVQDELDNRVQPIPADPPATAGENLEGEEPGYLGIVADDRQEQGRGVRVMDVVENSPAAQGGLAKNDLITSLNTTPIRNMEEMARILLAMPAGSKIVFGVQRGDAKSDVSVTLSQRPAPAERKFEKFGRQPDELPPQLPPGNRPKLGVRTLPVTEQAQRQFGLPSREGAIVVAVTPGSPAERAGIRMGAVITQLDGRVVRNPDQLADLVTSAVRDQFVLTLAQDGRQSRVTVKMVDEPFQESIEGPAPSLDPPAADETRWEAIERRLQQLEDRIEKIEQALEKRT
jgi:S1-C subfamily serine protease